MTLRVQRNSAAVECAVGSSRRWRESVLFRRIGTDLTWCTFHSAVSVRVCASELDCHLTPVSGVKWQSKPRGLNRANRARMRGTASHPDSDFARSCRQGGAVVQGARSAAARYGCSMRSGSQGIAGERSAPRPTPLHPHAHALSSPCPSCARRLLQ